MAISETKFRLAILGSGPVGKLLASAAQLHPRLEIVQYESDSLPLRPSFGYGLGPQAIRAFHLASHEIGKRIDERCVIGPDLMTWHHGGVEDRKIEDVKMPGTRLHGWIGRQELMDLLDGCMPDQVRPVHYDRSVVDVIKTSQGLELSFKDGSTDTVDAIWGSDGINSLARKVVQGADWKPLEYSGGICWRGKVPAQDVRAAIGPQLTKGQTMFVGVRGWHVLLFPFEGGNYVNIAGFCLEPEQKKPGRSYVPTEEDVLAYFPGRNGTVEKALKLLVEKGGVQRLELNHLGHLGSFTNPDLAITLFGDAANAMTPYLAGSMATGIVGVVVFLREWNKRVRALSADATAEELLKLFNEASRAYENYQKPLAQEISDRALSQGFNRWNAGVTDHDKLLENFLFIWSVADDLQEC